MDRSSARHAIGRVQSGFDLRALVAEYRALRASILHLWNSKRNAGDEMEADDVTRFNEALDQLLAESIVSYTERVDQSREIFLGILGHDLRSPLNAVSLMASLLEDHGELTGLAREMASQIAVSVQAMDRMVTDLLDFTGTRLGATMVVTRQPMDIGQLCTEVIEEIRVVHSSRVFTYENRGGGVGDWDPARLRQLITNLLGNAVQHGSSTTPIGLSIQGEEDSVTLVIRNHGTPIPRDLIPGIFDPLRRHQNNSLPRPQGSIGLGLYIAREVATAHGGTIAVNSSESETVFTVNIPRRLDQR